MGGGIVGGGIVGSATARELLLQYPHLKVVLLEKEENLGMHQSSHNSGVIHSGLYYQPGSKRAKLCVAGSDLMYKYCQARGIPYDKCGKVIVAVRPDELSQLENLYRRGIENGVRDLRILDTAELKNIEPYCNGLRAIHVPGTGITDFGQVVQALARDAVAMGFGIGELYRDIVPTAYLAHLTPYMPDLTIEYIDFKVKPSGVRAQAIGADGKLVEDFVFDIPTDRSIIHVRNAPSPAATSSLAIAQEIVQLASTIFGLQNLHYM